MNDDGFFEDSQPRKSFGRGKSKAINLKPWQTQVNGEAKATMFRCWDGLLGCEGYKPKEAFRMHPLICDQCSEPLVYRFGISRTDVELLTMILHMDAGFYRTSKYFKAKPEKIQAMEAGRDQYISQFLQAVKPLRSRFEIEAKQKAFQGWFYDQVEVELPNGKTKPVSGFSTIGDAVPVGDR